MPWISYPKTSGFVSFNGQGAIGAGNAVNVAGFHDFSLQVTFAGSPSSVIVNLEATVDGANWFTIATFNTSSNSSGDIVFAVDKPVAQVRANLATLSGGTTPTVTATIGAV